MADNALGTFLRQRRDALAPSHRGRPGVRRAEVATLSGVSVDYLTRLEQGRDRHPSAQVLAALADTLQMTYEERLLLMRLGTIASSGEMCPQVQPPDREVRPSVQLLVAGMEPMVAAVTDRLGDVLVHTAAWARLFGGIGVLDDARPNLIRYLFADPRARTSFPAWGAVADEVAAELAPDCRPDDPSFDDFLATLGEAGARDLLVRLDAGPSVARPARVVRIVHPAVGELQLSYESMPVAESDQRLVVHLPRDDAAAAALDCLVVGGQSLLRAVPD